MIRYIGTPRYFGGRVCVDPDEGSLVFSKDTVNQNILRLLPRRPLTPVAQCGRQQHMLSRLPSRLPCCGDDVPAYQHYRSGLPIRSGLRVRLDRTRVMCYAHELGACSEGRGIERRALDRLLLQFPDATIGLTTHYRQAWERATKQLVEATETPKEPMEPKAPERWVLMPPHEVHPENGLFSRLIFTAQLEQGLYPRTIEVGSVLNYPTSFLPARLTKARKRAEAAVAALNGDADD